jgi:hypothetical protein
MIEGRDLMRVFEFMDGMNDEFAGARRLDVPTTRPSSKRDRSARFISGMRETDHHENMPTLPGY